MAAAVLEYLKHGNVSIYYSARIPKHGIWIPTTNLSQSCDDRDISPWTKTPRGCLKYLTLFQISTPRGIKNFLPLRWIRSPVPTCRYIHRWQTLLVTWPHLVVSKNTKHFNGICMVIRSLFLQWKNPGPQVNPSQGPAQKPPASSVHTYTTCSVCCSKHINWSLS